MDSFSSRPCHFCPLLCCLCCRTTTLYFPRYLLRWRCHCVLPAQSGAQPLNPVCCAMTIDCHPCPLPCFTPLIPTAPYGCPHPLGTPLASVGPPITATVPCFPPPPVLATSCFVSFCCIAPGLIFQLPSSRPTVLPAQLQPQQDVQRQGFLLSVSREQVRGGPCTV